MKKILLSLCLCLATVAVYGQTRYAAETLTVPTVSGDGGVSNSIAAVIDCRFQPDVALSIRTTSTNSVWRLSSSVDNSTWNTNQYVIGIVDKTETTTTVTNLNVKGIGYLRIDSVLNTGTINATNTVKYAVKRY